MRVDQRYTSTMDRLMPVSSHPFELSCSLSDMGKYLGVSLLCLLHLLIRYHKAW